MLLVGWAGNLTQWREGAKGAKGFWFRAGRLFGAGNSPAASGAWFRAAGLAVDGRGLDARDTLILAFSHEGRRDPLAALGAWFWAAGLVGGLWIPAFAGMTG